MARKRVKGIKYGKVTKQQKYRLLHACLVEQKSIHEVWFVWGRQPLKLEFTIQLQRPFSFSTKDRTNHTLISPSATTKKPKEYLIFLEQPTSLWLSTSIAKRCCAQQSNWYPPLELGSKKDEKINALPVSQLGRLS